MNDTPKHKIATFWSGVVAYLTDISRKHKNQSTHD